MTSFEDMIDQVSPSTFSIWSLVPPLQIIIQILTIAALTAGPICLIFLAIKLKRELYGTKKKSKDSK